jgi:sulfopropanediol 3-dehydrogenase
MAIKYIKKGMAADESAANQAKTRQIVEGILSDVETRGDEAVKELSSKFDKWSPESFRLSDNQIQRFLKKQLMILNGLKLKYVALHRFRNLL